MAKKRLGKVTSGVRIILTLKTCVTDEGRHHSSAWKKARGRELTLEKTADLR